MRSRKLESIRCSHSTSNDFVLFRNKGTEWKHHTHLSFACPSLLIIKLIRKIWEGSLVFLRIWLIQLCGGNMSLVPQEILGWQWGVDHQLVSFAQCKCISKNCGKVFFSCNLIQMSTFIFSRFIKHEVKYFKLFFVLILMITVYSSWKSKIQSRLRNKQFSFKSHLPSSSPDAASSIHYACDSGQSLLMSLQGFLSTQVCWNCWAYHVRWTTNEETWREETSWFTQQGIIYSPRYSAPHLGL